MNPYEKYYLRQKLVTAAIAVGATAVIGGGALLLLSAGGDSEDADDKTPQVGQEMENNQNMNSEKDPAASEDTERREITLPAGSRKVDCWIYEGDGWTIPYPKDWTVVEKQDEVHFVPPDSTEDGTCVTVSLSSRAEYSGSFIAIGAKQFADGTAGLERMFYHGGEGGYAVSGKMKDEDWESFEKIMNAMSRTMTVGDQSPFASLYPMASQPEWQVVDGELVLFLDKDGADMDSVVDEAVKARLNGMSSEERACLTGEYRLGSSAWDSEYTCIGEDYIDVFCLTVEFKIASGKANEIELKDGQSIRNGWLVDESTLLYVAVFHDGSTVSRRVSSWGDAEFFGAEFASRVLR